MGLFSGIFGSKAEWDANIYVSKIAGNKHWHKSFIDMDAMRQYGIWMAFQLEPLDTAPNAPQSPKTMVGELIFLFQKCDEMGDVNAKNTVIKAIIHFVENHIKEIPDFAVPTISMSCYDEALWERLNQYL